MASKIREEKEVSKQQREQIAELVKMYLTGKLDTMIEFEALKAEADPAIGGTDYSSCTGGSGGQGVNVIEKFDTERRKAIWKKNRLIRVKKMIEMALRLIDQEHKKVLELFYRDRYSILRIAGKMGYARRTIDLKKMQALNELAKHIDLKRCKIV